jgi:hypothetical protein
MPPAFSPSSIKSSRQARRSSSYISSFSPLRESAFWRFFVNFAKLVAIPGLIAILLVELLAWRTGADITVSVAAIAELQHEDPDILWGGPGQLTGPLALARIKIEHPAIIMIGDSRCGQMRSMMFKPYSFHNTCFVAWTFNQIKNMIDLATRSGGPKTIMFTLDYFMFGDAYAKQWQEKAFMDFAPPQRQHLDGLLNLAAAFKRRPGAMLKAMPSYLFGRAREPANGLELLGPDAIAAQAGYRSDGSGLYDAVTRSQSPVNNTQLDRLLGAVREGDGAQPSPIQMRALQEIGGLGKQRNLTLVGIQLPVLQGALDVLDSDKDWHGFRATDRGTWRLLQSVQIRQALTDMGIHFFDLTRDPVAKQSAAFVDPAHPSEYAIGMALADRMNDDPEFRALFPRLDVTALQGALAAAKKQERLFDVYGAQF